MLKVRIYPEPKLHEIWQSWKAAIRFVYNTAIEALKSGFEGGSYQLEALILSNDLLPEWVKNAPRHPKANAVQDAFDSWKQARKNQGIASYRSCRTPVQTIKFKVGGFRNTTWYPNLTKGLSFKSSQPLPENCEYGTQLVYDRHRWFAVIPQYVNSTPTQQDKVIALDPGVRTFLTGFDGESVLEFGKGDIGRIVRLCLHLDKLMSNTDGKDIRTKQCRAYRRAAEKIRIKIRNLVDDAHKKIASYLVNNYKVIFLPTFETSNMVRRAKRRIHKKTARQMLNWSHYRFKQTLKSMAALKNVLVVDTNEAYTSKTCTFCGHVHKKLGGSKIFKCSNCGSHHDRDWNGARNIMLRALSGATFTLWGDAIEVFNCV
ncbi:transposase, IS605 OrfB family [Crinalium epipsammum PCC 9333]|uniref:Transposase, IS605 OrfB family n=1 Tax=Crinalium epipsammum PCC 9333 TaxID=1173022 RepID=K9W2Q9_9CYAN|nr:transposase, IS605 OrfB family [Crinalium epipsammum PCC 9333]